MNTRSILAAFVLLAASHASLAQNQMLDALKSGLGNVTGSPESSGASGSTSGMAAAALSGLGISMPAMGSSTMGNAAGVLQYCVKNNYLSADAAGGIKDRLLGMVTGNKAQQKGYNNGTNGLLQGSDGGSFNLKKVGSKIKTKACDYVLENAKSLI